MIAMICTKVRKKQGTLLHMAGYLSMIVYYFSSAQCVEVKNVTKVPSYQARYTMCRQHVGGAKTAIKTNTTTTHEANRPQLSMYDTVFLLHSYVLQVTVS